MNDSLKFEFLSAGQSRLWDEFVGVPTEFTLYGGTALALHLGHRASLDFDFFGGSAFNPADVYARIPFLVGAEIIQQKESTLTCLVSRGEPVRVSFFGVPLIRRVGEPHVSIDNRLKIASLLDLAGTKAAVVQQRAQAKDYFDLDAILGAGIRLSSALSSAAAIYGPSFNPQITLKALCYFDDGDLAKLPDDVKRRLVDAVAETDLDRLPHVEPRGGLEISAEDATP